MNKTSIDNYKYPMTIETTLIKPSDEDKNESKVDDLEMTSTINFLNSKMTTTTTNGAKNCPSIIDLDNDHKERQLVLQNDDQIDINAADLDLNISCFKVCFKIFFLISFLRGKLFSKLICNNIFFSLCILQIIFSSFSCCYFLLFHLANRHCCLHCWPHIFPLRRRLIT